MKENISFFLFFLLFVIIFLDIRNDFMYLIYGESFRLIEEEIEKIIKDSNNKVEMDLMTTSLEDVLTEATYVSMFSEKKYIIVKNANFFGSGKITDEEVDMFLEYMKNPVDLSVLLFI